METDIGERGKEEQEQGKKTFAIGRQREMRFSLSIK